MQNQRVVWVIEVQTHTGRWIALYHYDTRIEARQIVKSMDCSGLRVAKYVPAETYKKAGVK